MSQVQHHILCWSRVLGIDARAMPCDFIQYWPPDSARGITEHVLYHERLRYIDGFAEFALPHYRAYLEQVHEYRRRVPGWRFKRAVSRSFGGKDRLVYPRGAQQEGDGGAMSRKMLREMLLPQ